MLKQILFVPACLLAFFAVQAQVKQFPEVPGVVLSHIPASTKQIIGSPSICILPNGYYLASHDFGPELKDRVSIAYLFLSKNQGRDWKKIAVIEGQRWSALFVHNEQLYIMGPEKPGGDVLIRRSTDNGYTWSNPVDSATGRLLQGKFHTAPTPVVVHNGRIWKAMEDMNGPKGRWGNSFRSFMMSAPVDADLMKSERWTVTNTLGYDSTYLDGKFNGWLEGNAVPAPDGNMMNILRTDYRMGTNEKVSMISISKDGRTASFDASTGFIPFPGGCKKFSIRYDSVSRLYWSLTNFIPEQYSEHNPERTRNTLALVWSDNLLSWHIKAIVLHHPDVEKHAFQYADFQFDGDDLVFVSRTAFDDGMGGAKNQHDANFLTYHKIELFRTASTPDKWKHLLPK